MSKPTNDWLIGKRFGKLLVLRRDENPMYGYFICRCDCGNLKSVQGAKLKSGKSTSCASCKIPVEEVIRPDLDCNTKLYAIWKSMRQRCSNPNFYEYEYYGGRGVTVCSAWEKWPAFKDWALSSGYEEGLSIDRIDPAGAYEPRNCQWLTRSENSKKMVRECKARKEDPQLTLAEVVA